MMDEFKEMFRGMKSTKIQKILRKKVVYDELHKFLKKERYQLWAIWMRNCWRCNTPIYVAMNTVGISFNPFRRQTPPLDDEKIEEFLRKQGVTRKLLYPKTKYSYYVNVCPYCFSVQGDWFLMDELLDEVVDPSPSFRLVLFKNGDFIKEYFTVESFEQALDELLGE